MLIRFSFLFLFALGVTAAETTTEQRSLVIQDRVFSQTELQKIQKDASRFQLSAEEWLEYEEHMKGTLGKRNQNLDPVWVLGMKAKTPEQRRKYAELAAVQEKNYVEEVLAFQRSFTEANKRLFGDGLVMLQGMSDKGKSSIVLNKNPGKLLAGDRILFFTKARACAECDEYFNKVVSNLKKLKGLGLDIYFLDSTDNNDLVQAWAREKGILAADVKAKNITLNHDKGTLQRIAPSYTGPATILRRQNKFYEFDVTG